MRFSKASIFTICLSVIISETASAQMSAREIMQKVEDQAKVQTQVTKSKMVLTNKTGKTREREVTRYQKDQKGVGGIDAKMLIFFEFPADIRGTGLLLWQYTDMKKDDDRWLYLPALKKVRRIAGESKNEYFMGTDFTYDDIGGRELDEDTHKLLGTEEIAGVKCYKIEAIPVKVDDTYGRRLIWVIPEKWVAFKVEFYSKSGTLIKVLQADDVRNVNGIWMAFDLLMKNFSENHQTRLTITECRNNVPLKDEIFTTATLERGKVQ